MAAILAGLSFGVVPIFSAILHDLHVSSVEQSFIRLIIGLLAGVVIVVFYTSNHHSDIYNSLTGSIQGTYIIQGVIIAVGLNFYLASIVLETPVGEAALLCQIHPIFTFVIAGFFLKESITRNKIVALILAMSGIVILTQPWEWTSFLGSFAGSMLALLSGVDYSLYLIVGAYFTSKREKVSPLISIGWILIWAFIMWIPIFFLTQLMSLPTEISNFSLMTYSSLLNLLYGICLGTIGNVIPFGLIMFASTRIESSRASILLLGEPLGAIIFGAIILQESITFGYILGGFLLLTAVIIILTQANNDESEEAQISLVVQAID